MKHLFLLLLASASLHAESIAPFKDWRHSGTLTILTDSAGADLPATAEERDFPLLVRLHKDWFDFSQTHAQGADLRFSDNRGTPLAHQIESWDAALGEAAIWVRIPVIKGQERQPLRLHWGNSAAPDASDSKAVFNASNGFLSVWHMGADSLDATGLLTTKDTGTTPTPGLIGGARHFPGKAGLLGGDNITGYPTGSAPHSTEAWFRAERPNSTVVAWGNEKAQGKVVMQYRSPSHVSMDCYFSGGNVKSAPFPSGQWIHVAHTYESGMAKIYVDGELSASNASRGTPLNIQNPARLWIGGWYGNYDFIGDIDEVRISSVTRSPAWIRLSHANQQPFQTLHGPLLRPSSTGSPQALSIEPASASIDEGTTLPFTATTPDAQKITWSLVRDGREQVVAVDRLHHSFTAARIRGDSSAKLILRAVTARGTESREIPITIRESVPEPVVTLRAPARWDGRSTLRVVPEITNRSALQNKGVGALDIRWTIADLAVTHEADGETLRLTRAQNSGTITVTASVSNGGPPTSASTTIEIREPASEPWMARTPEPDEKPTDHQFYARDDRNEGTLFCNGTLAAPHESATLAITADGKPFALQTQKPGSGGRYAFAVRLKPGLIHYRAVLTAGTANANTSAPAVILHEADDLVCGDAFLLMGQSNTVSTDFGKEDPTFRSEWIRSFGSMSGNPTPLRLWGNAVHRNRDGEKVQIGYWGMELARRILEKHQIPVCILNGAVGGTRIDQHQRSAADPADTTTLYGRLLWRAREARLTHGIRGILWHQGENDQGADGPTGGYGYEQYRSLFLALAAAWKQDYPNVQAYHAFQIWPKSCAMGIDGSDNRLREVQRNLPTAFAKLSVMSTLGIDPPGGCHFPAAGYAEFARLIFPLLERDHYGVKPQQPITAPNLLRASFNSTRDEVALTFDQPVLWDSALASQFTIDGTAGSVTEGRADGSRITLRLKTPGGSSITYLDSKQWSQKTLLRGGNGIAALTFCEVPISPAP